MNKHRNTSGVDEAGVGGTLLTGGCSGGGRRSTGAVLSTTVSVAAHAAAKAVPTGEPCQLAMAAARHLGVTPGRVEDSYLLCGSSKIAETGRIMILAAMTSKAATK